jgi:hypothetical protein
MIKFFLKSYFTTTILKKVRLSFYFLGVKISFLKVSILVYLFFNKNSHNPFFSDNFDEILLLIYSRPRLLAS